MKPTAAAAALMPAAVYEGAKEMLLVERVDDKAFLTELFTAMYDELPAPKPKRKNPPGAANGSLEA